MNEQMIILCFIILGLFFTLYLYIWKAKKEIEYKKDERWYFIQNKANQAANLSNYILIVFVAIGEAVLLYQEIEVMITLNRVLIYAMLFIGLRNMIEVLALRYYDSHM